MERSVIYIFQNLRVKYYQVGDRVSETELAKGGLYLFRSCLNQPLSKRKSKASLKPGASDVYKFFNIAVLFQAVHR